MAFQRGAFQSSAFQDKPKQTAAGRRPFRINSYFTPYKRRAKRKREDELIVIS